LAGKTKAQLVLNEPDGCLGTEIFKNSFPNKKWVKPTRFLLIALGFQLFSS
jgi:hypothetical protein